jgi:lysophospholipase L1-like esterase
MTKPTFTRRRFFGAAGGAAAAGALLLAPEAATARRRPAVTALGDSLSDTVFFPDSYPHWLPRYLPGLEISARGEAGDLTGDVLARCRTDGIVDYLAIDRLRGLKPHPVPAGRYCAVLAGVNDLCHDLPPSHIIGNLSSIYAYLRRHRSTPFAITILPWGGSAFFRPRRESVRLAVNDWIRRQPQAIDVERLMGNGRTPPALRRSFDGGDGLHPVGDGPRVLARAVASAIRRHERVRVSRGSPGPRAP